MDDKEKQKKLKEIAEKLGTSTQQLLEEYKNADAIIEKYETGELQLLNE
jgi:predicted DNA-binding protein YlxM (UPF0122 family)